MPLKLCKWTIINITVVIVVFVLIITNFCVVICLFRGKFVFFSDAVNKVIVSFNRFIAYGFVLHGFYGKLFVQDLFFLRSGNPGKRSPLLSRHVNSPPQCLCVRRFCRRRQRTSTIAMRSETFQRVICTRRTTALSLNCDHDSRSLAAGRPTITSVTIFRAISISTTAVGGFIVACNYVFLVQ